MSTSRASSRREVAVRSGAAAAAVAVLLLVLLGRGPGSLVWLTGRPPSWLPFAGAGLGWLPFEAGWLPFGADPAPARPTAALSPSPPALALAATPGPTPTAVPTPVAAAPRPVATPPSVPPAPKPTPTPKPVPTPTPAAPTPSPVLFADTFESDVIGGQPAGWHTDGTFSIAEDGTHVLYTPSGTWAVASAGQGTWVNYSVSASLKAASTTGHSRLVARYQGAGAYYGCGLDHGGYLYLGRVDRGSWTDLKVTPYAFSPGQFYRATFSVSGSTLTCSVSDPGGALKPLSITLTDATYASGAAGWVAEGPGEVDNFKVTALR